MGKMKTFVKTYHTSIALILAAVIIASAIIFSTTILCDAISRAASDLGSSIFMS